MGGIQCGGSRDSRGLLSRAAVDAWSNRRISSLMQLVAGYRLNWNPETNPDDITDEYVAAVRSDGSVDLDWRCGNAAILPGHNVVLVKTGKIPAERGIVGLGLAISKPRTVRQVRGVRVRLTTLSLSPLVKRSALDVPPLDEVAWSNQNAAARLERRHVAAIEQLLAATRDQAPPMSEEDARVRVERAIVLRQGRPQFRSMLERAYEARCAISDCDAMTALEAAHIRPYRGPDTDRVENGLLLRADLHTLFDLFLVGIDASSWTVVVSSELKNTSYARLHGGPVRLPARAEDRPNQELLREHLASVQAVRSQN